MRLSLVPRTSEFYDLFTAAGENALEAARQVDARFRAFPEREVRPGAGQGAREQGRRPHAPDHRAPEHAVHHSVRPGGHLRAREGDRRRRRLHRERVRPPHALQGRAPDAAVARAVPDPRRGGRAPCQGYRRAARPRQRRAPPRRGQGARRRGGQSPSRGDRRPLREPRGSRRGDPLEGHLRGARGRDRRPRIAKLEPPEGFAAQTACSSILWTTAHYGFPVSTTHTISGSVLGAGASSRLSAVRWGVAGNILMAWVLTIPCAALVGAGMQTLTRVPGGAVLVFALTAACAAFLGRSIQARRLRVRPAHA